MLGFSLVRVPKQTNVGVGSEFFATTENLGLVWVHFSYALFSVWLSVQCGFRGFIFFQWPLKLLMF